MLTGESTEDDIWLHSSSNHQIYTLTSYPSQRLNRLKWINRVLNINSASDESEVLDIGRLLVFQQLQSLILSVTEGECFAYAPTCPANRFSAVQFTVYICTRFARYLDSIRCSWIILYSMTVALQLVSGFIMYIAHSYFFSTFIV